MLPLASHWRYNPVSKDAQAGCTRKSSYSRFVPYPVQCLKEKRHMTIDISQLIVWIIVGAIAGWLAGLVMRGRSLGTLSNIIVGLLGALVGGILFTIFRITVPAFLNGSLTIRLADIVIAF